MFFCHNCVFFTQFLLNFIQDNIDLNIKNNKKKSMFNYIARLYNFIFTQVKINSLFHNVHKHNQANQNLTVSQKKWWTAMEEKK